jgi:hypothetical protein
VRPEDLAIFHALKPDQIGGETVYLEAGGEPEEGRIAVAWVIRMRVDHPSFQGRDVETVCFHEASFSCYLSAQGTYAKALAIARDFPGHLYGGRPIQGWSPLDARALSECHDIFEGVMSGSVPNPFAPLEDVFMYWAEGSPRPSWADKLPFVRRIGKHNFHRGR